MNGATNVPDGNFTLVLAYFYGSGMTLTAPNAPTVTNVTFNAPVPSPLPSPAATPEPGATPRGYGIPALQSGTTYTINAQFTSLDTNCTMSSTALGTFTTK